MPDGGLRLAAASVVAVPLALVVLLAALSGASAGCADAAAPAVDAGSWLATAYGPPWSDGNGSGITATGMNLTADPALLEVAVDPTAIALRSYVYVQPN